LSLKPDQPYVAVLLHLARLRLKTPDEAEFAGNVANLKLSKWPAPIVEFYQRKLKPDQLRTDAANGPAEDANARNCEAEFYIAQDLLVAHKADDARRGLMTARQTCPNGFIEYEIARMELGEV
jgi:lipoprotein NlpI